MTSYGDNLLTTNELAERLNVSPAKVMEKARQGIIPHIRWGTRYRFDLKEVRRALDAVKTSDAK